MRNWLSAAVGVGTLALLVGCSGSSSNMQVVDPSGKGPPGGVRQFISLGENLGYAFEFEPIMGHARSMKPVGDAFHRSLYEGYMEHAEYEFGPLNMDYRDAIYAGREGHGRGAGQHADADRDERARRALRQDRRADAGAAAGWSRPWPPARRPPTRKRPAWRRRSSTAGWSSSTRTSSRRTSPTAGTASTNLQIIEQKPSQMPRAGGPATATLLRLQQDDLCAAVPARAHQLADMLVKDTTPAGAGLGLHRHGGTPEYNLKLSEQRAETVADYLQSKGVSSSRMEIKGWGETHLAVQTPDNTPDQRNRRVEVRRR